MNNLKEGGKVLVRSSGDLTSLDGIATLMVTDGGEQVALARAPRNPR